MQENGSFQYFKYDNSDDADWRDSIKMGNVENDFKGKTEIISWHYNYNSQEFVFIDKNGKVWKLFVSDDMDFSEDPFLKRTLNNLGNGKKDL